ncbi:aspartate racemase/maleate isomerase family protein [Meridianimarinicoccus sp. RP-17]|uniref:aspartate racemase/maleate isomerase family protein n=1 Tax=Meridianimarinicoccus zhengii TaxID=2056810 RepID=UPI000DAD949A|nr:ectoine utilization protein EutA [Phycocomes zhengii]
MDRHGAVTPSEVAVALDPADAVARLGLIVLSTDLTTERDAARIVPPDHAAVHVARVPFQNPTTPENLRRMAPLLTRAADLILPGEPLAGIYYACTSASVVIGDAEVGEAIHAARPGVPVVTPTAASLDAFAALGVRRIALVTPYLPCTTVPMVGYFERGGLETVSAHCLGMEDDRDMARVSAQTIIDAVLAADSDAAEAVFLSCTALPALGVIDTLEARLGKPVVTSNQAGLWRMLRHAGLMADRAPGRIFATPLGVA